MERRDLLAASAAVLVPKTLFRIASVALAGAGDVPVATSFISAISSVDSGRRKARLPNEARNASRQLCASGDVDAQLPARVVRRWLVFVAPSATALATLK